VVRKTGSSERAVRRKVEILRGAAAVFRDRGFDGAGMRQIADAIGMAPAALYYYFRSKEDLLYFCQNYSLDRMIAEARRIERAKLPAGEKLKTAIAAQLRCMLDELHGSGAHLEFRSIPRPKLSKIIAKRDAYERCLRRIIAAGVRSGAFRPVDVKLASLALLGAINWTIKWYRPGGPRDAEAIGIAFADVLIHGLGAAAPPRGGRPRANEESVRRAQRAQRKKLPL
jgi:AcrR family transcriptional regulator